MDQQTIDVIRGTQAAYSTQDALTRKAQKHGWRIWVDLACNERVMCYDKFCHRRHEELRFKIIIHADCTIAKWPD